MVVAPSSPPIALPSANLAAANRLALLDGGQAAYPAMLAAIAGAERQVFLEVYSFSPSGWGAQFIEALIGAARRGVKVQVKVDGWGSLFGGRTVARRLRAGGCACTIYNPLLTLLLLRLRRDHRKILLVDDRVAFLGGINIGDEYAGSEAAVGWADLALAIEGPACHRLGQRLRGEPPTRASAGLRIYLSGESGGRRLRQRYHKAFVAARRQLLVAHAYFLPDHGLVRALRNAVRRGVAVRLLLAGVSDVPLVHAATMSLYRSLLGAGVQIYEWAGSVLHAKVATVDGRRLLIGSFNLDPLSLANLETLVEVEEPEVVQSAEEWIERHLRTSRQVTLADIDRSRWQRWVGDRLSLVAARLMQLFGRLLHAR